MREYMLIKLIAGVTGSHFTNAVFMQDDTAICDIGTDYRVTFFMFMGLATNKRYYAAENLSISHFSSDPCYVHPDLFIKLITAAIQDQKDN